MKIKQLEVCKKPPLKKYMENINSGVILEEPPMGVYVVGAIEPNITCSDFTPYLPTGEKQHSVYFDTLACVSFSAINCVETIFNYQIKHNMICKANLRWLEDNGYMVNGEVNFSDRAIAKLSGTTDRGNTGFNVASAMREFGLVPESMWNYPIDQKNPVYTREDYYSEIPQEVYDMGREFKKRFDFNYLSIARSQFKVQSKHSPLQVYVYAWDKPINGVYLRTTKPIGHAVEYFVGKWKIFDTYFQYGSYIKTLAPDYILYPTGYQYIITDIPPKITKPTENMPKTLTKIFDEEGSKRIWVAQEATSEQALYAMMRNAGLQPPTVDDKPNTIDFPNMEFDGTVKDINFVARQEYKPVARINWIEKLINLFQKNG